MGNGAGRNKRTRKRSPRFIEAVLLHGGRQALIREIKNEKVRPVEEYRMGNMGENVEGCRSRLDLSLSAAGFGERGNGAENAIW